ncbi:MAG TPA: hypothetical protein GX531_03555 [Methanothermobacter sp.]|nr:hypothetical protein [Methanothermobacter sp.]
MFDNSVIEEKRGMVFSTDLMMALIIITVVLGVSADAMDNVGSQIQDYCYANSLDRITTAAADMMIKDPGEPENWEELGNFDGVIPGLADADQLNKGVTQKTLSLQKIKCLKENYDELMKGKILPPYCDSSLTICPVDSSIEPVAMGKVSTSASDIIVINRTVLCNFCNASIIVCMNPMNCNSNTPQPKQGEYICPHQDKTGNHSHIWVDYHNKKSGWTCHPFRVTQDMLNSGDFYLMTDPGYVTDNSAVWIIDSPENITKETNHFNSQPILLNDVIKDCIGSKSTCVLWLHVFSSGNTQKAFNTYLTVYPKGTSVETVKIQYLNPQPCYFIFKVST